MFVPRRGGWRHRGHWQASQLLQKRKEHQGLGAGHDLTLGNLVLQLLEVVVVVDHLLLLALQLLALHALKLHLLGVHMWIVLQARNCY